MFYRRNSDFALQYLKKQALLEGTVVAWARYATALERAHGVWPPEEPEEEEKEKPDFRMGYWCRQANFAQSAANAGALLRSATQCLDEWRNFNGEYHNGGQGDWNGQDCIPYRFMLYQVCDHLSHVCRLNQDMGWFDASEFCEQQEQLYNDAEQHHHRHRHFR